MAVHYGLKIGEKLKLRTLIDRALVEVRRPKSDREAILQAVESLAEGLVPFVRLAHEDGQLGAKREAGREKEVFLIINQTTGGTKEIVGWDDLATYVGLAKATLAVYFSRAGTGQTKGLAIDRHVRGDPCTIIRKTKAEVLQAKGVELSPVEPKPKPSYTPPKPPGKYKTPFPKGHGAEE